LRGKHEDELLAAESANGVAGAELASEQSGDGAEDGVAAGVAEGIVEPLEVVDVHDDDGEVLVAAAIACEFDFAGVLQAASIEQLGEGIGDHLALHVGVETGIHHPDDGEGQHGAGDDVDHSAGDLDPGCGEVGGFAGGDVDDDAGTLDCGIEEEKGGQGAARPEGLGVARGEEQPGGEGRDKGEDEVDDGEDSAVVCGVGPEKTEREGDDDKRDGNPACVSATADEVDDAGMDAGEANGSGHHGESRGSPRGQIRTGKLQQACHEASGIGICKPPDASVGPVLDRHKNKDQEERSDLGVLDEADGVCKHRFLDRGVFISLYRSGRIQFLEVAGRVVFE